MIAKPATLIGWHRAVFRLFRRWKSRSVGRPPVTAEVRELIHRLACDFFTAVTATFRVIYVFVGLEIGSRRLVHFNATELRPQSGRCSRR
jgi:hypothetical protein